MPSEDFFIKLKKISAENNIKPQDLLLVMYMESGLKPNAVNPDGKATGLIQFMPSTLKLMKVPEQDIKNFKHKSAVEQLDYVSQYIKGVAKSVGGKFSSAAQYYHANFFPLTLSRWHSGNVEDNLDVVVVSSTSKDQREVQAYKHNALLDPDKKGFITVRDLNKILMRRANEKGYQDALRQLNAVTGSSYQMQESKNKDIELLDSKSEKSTLSKIMEIFNQLKDKFSVFASKNNSYSIYVNNYGNQLDELFVAKKISSHLNSLPFTRASIVKNKNGMFVNCLFEYESDNNKQFNQLNRISKLIINKYASKSFVLVSCGLENADNATYVNKHKRSE